MRNLLRKAAGALPALYAAPALAQSGRPDDFGLSYGSGLGLGQRDLRTTAIDIVNILLGFLGVVAVILIIWGGFRWMTAAGDEQQVDGAKKMITGAVIGLVIILASFAIATFVLEQVATQTGATGTFGST